MEGHGLSVAFMHEGLRKHVLARVLLHVVEPPVPVYPPVHALALKLAAEDVPHRVINHNNVRDGRVAATQRSQDAQVVWLAPSGRVEGRSIKCDGRLSGDLPARNHPRVEFAQVGVKIIEFFCAQNASD
jgi:hypothetical protein